jgi:5-carboxymethyl-2-hydroxymuconate isomerase
MMNTTTTKTTKRDRFVSILATYDFSAEDRAFLEHELELLENRSNREKKPTAAQIMNAGIKDEIFSGMEKDRIYTVTEIIKEIPACNGFTNQRASALVNQMVDENRVEKIIEKRRSYFRAVK